MNPLAPAHHREYMERASRRMTLLVRIAELRRIIPEAEREGEGFACNRLQKRHRIARRTAGRPALGSRAPAHTFLIIFPNIFKTQIPYW